MLCIGCRLIKEIHKHCPILHVLHFYTTLQWHHDGRDSFSNHQPRDCLLNLLFRYKSNKTSMLRVTGLCAWNSPGTGEFPAQMASYAEHVSIWWRHHVSSCYGCWMRKCAFCSLAPEKDWSWGRGNCKLQEQKARVEVLLVSALC